MKGYPKFLIFLSLFKRGLEEKDLTCDEVETIKICLEARIYNFAKFNICFSVHTFGTAEIILNPGR